jgi:hypothetical protein
MRTPIGCPLLEVPGQLLNICSIWVHAETFFSAPRLFPVRGLGAGVWFSEPVGGGWSLPRISHGAQCPLASFLESEVEPAERLGLPEWWFVSMTQNLALEEQKSILTAVKRSSHGCLGGCCASCAVVVIEG